MSRIRSFILWCLYFICPTDLYLKLHGYNPDEIGNRFNTIAQDTINRNLKS